MYFVLEKSVFLTHFSDHSRLEIFTAVVAEKARGGNFLHFLRHGGNKFYFPPPHRK
jgi:hypothetical protein